MPKFAMLPGLFVLAFTGCAAGAPTDTTTLYKSVGPDGRTVYSDRAPAAGPPAQAMTFDLLPSSPLAPATLAYIAQLKKAADDIRNSRVAASRVEAARAQSAAQQDFEESQEQSGRVAADELSESVEVSESEAY